MDGSLNAIIWQNCENGCNKVWKLTIMFLKIETFSDRTLCNVIYMGGPLILDFELL